VNRVFPLLIILAGLALAVPSPAAAGTTGYILALGDSATAGTQPIAPAPPDQPGGAPETEVNCSGEGYADQLVARLQGAGQDVQLVNLACYYETTRSMRAGNGLCSYPNGSQLEEAAEFLDANGEDVRAIVFSIGANDMLRSCPFLDGACYQTQLGLAQKNLGKILKTLRDVGGDVPIAMITYWDPFLALYLVPGLGLPVAQATVSGIVLPLKRMIETASAPYDVVVDTLATFETANFTDMRELPGVGLVPVNVRNMCVYSWMCTYNDIHLNAAGYGLVARAVEHALGLDRARVS
jgi:lysophospholipase L1-like esterase